MMSSLDAHTLDRLDQALVVDFLTSMAAIFGEAGLMSPKDMDNLRLVLSGISTSGDRTAFAPPLIIQLADQRAEFLDFLAVRFGMAGFCSNLTRHALRSSLEDTERLLADFGQALLKKAEIFFNRPFRVWRAGRCVKITLTSTVLADLAESLAAAKALVTAVRSELGMMHPCDFALGPTEERDLDLALAAALGFSAVEQTAIPFGHDGEVRRKLTQALALVADATAEFSEQLAANRGEDAAHDAVAAAEWLKAEGQRFALMALPTTESLLAWEVRRRSLMTALHGTNLALRRLMDATMIALTRDHRQVAGPAPHPESLWRRLAFDLIKGGTAPALAREAVAALNRYLELHQLGPRQVLVGELSRIHPALTADTLATLSKIVDDLATMSLAATEKSATMSRVRSLGRFFASALPNAATTLVLLLALAATSACGLKTRPTSDVDELRPDVAYRGEAARKASDGSLPHGDTHGAKAVAPTASPMTHFP